MEIITSRIPNEEFEVDLELLDSKPEEQSPPNWEVVGLVDCIESPSDDHHDLPTPVLKPDSTNKWDPRLILDLATGVDDMPAILDRYGLTEIEYHHLSQTGAFRRDLAMAIRDARDNGITFATKARVQAEGYLEVLDTLVYDAATPASTRLEAIRSIVKWGRLEVEKSESGDGGSNSNINIQINF